MRSLVDAAPADVRFGSLWPGLLERHHVRLTDIQELVRELDEAKVVLWHRSGGARQRKPRDDERLGLRRQPADG